MPLSSGYQPIGIGNDLAHYVIKGNGYRPTMKQADMRPILIDAIAKAKDWVDGCGGFTELISISRDGLLSKLETLPIPPSMREI